MNLIYWPVSIFCINKIIYHHSLLSWLHLLLICFVFLLNVVKIIDLMNSSLFVLRIIQSIFGLNQVSKDFSCFLSWLQRLSGQDIKIIINKVLVWLNSNLFYSSFLSNLIHKNENSYSKRQWYPCYRR